MAFVALPIQDSNGVEMSTTLGIFTDGDGSQVRPVAIDNVIDAEQSSLSIDELNYQKENGTNSIPSSFDTAERFSSILKNPPTAVKEKPEYAEAENEYIGLLTVFACRNLLGLNIEKRQIDMNENSPSPLLRGLGNQLVKHGENRTLTYFSLDNKPFAYLYDNCLIPIKDRELYKKALLSVPFYNRAVGRFDDILSASSSNPADVDSGSLLYKQLLCAFLVAGNTHNENALFLRSLGAPYLNVTDRVLSACLGLQALPFISVNTPALNTLDDALLNAPVCDALPQTLFSDKLLLLQPTLFNENQSAEDSNNSNSAPCFGNVAFDQEDHIVVNPISKALCATISNNPNVILDNPNGAPDCSYEDGCITCRIRLTVFGSKMTIPRKYSVEENCIKSDHNNIPLESINMGIDCNVNPCRTIPLIFRRYIVWNGPECIGVSFDQPVKTFPVSHLGDKATVAIVEPSIYMPKFAFLDYYGEEYCGCIQFPAPLDPAYTQINTPTSIFLDFGTTNSICLVEHGDSHTYVDIKEFVTMVTGENAEFRIFHLLSDHDNNDTVRSMAICSVEANDYDSSLYRAHAINAGKSAIEYIVGGISSDGPLDLTSVNVYDNLKWTNDALANEGYHAVVGSIFSSAFAKLLQKGFNPDPKLTKICISVPSSMSQKEVTLTKHRVKQALTGIGCTHIISYQYYESTAAAFYFINDSNSGVEINDAFNVGVDIGGGSIDLFSFESEIGGDDLPIPSSIDSIKNAAGRKILSETFAKAAQYYYAQRTDPEPNSNPFFKCFDVKAMPPVSLNTASLSAALCITETFIPEAKFNEMAHGTTQHILNTFRRNVLFKTIAVLNYAAEFVKASWKTDKQGNPMDFSSKVINIILCGNGSSVYRREWSGTDQAEKDKITAFLQERIGCEALNVILSTNPKKETVTGMKYIYTKEGKAGALNCDMFHELADTASLTGRDTKTVKDYVNDLLKQITEKDLLEVSGDVDDLMDFHNLLKNAIKENNINIALNYVLNKDNIKTKGDGLLLADVFLRIALELPYIDPKI